MTAKSAPQLPAAKPSPGGLHRRTLLLLTLAVVIAGTAWLLEYEEARAVVVVPAPVVVKAPTMVYDEVAVVPVEGVLPPPENGRFRVLSDFVARRYKVSQAIAFDLVSIAHAAGRKIGLDPLLIIAVISIESRFNPIAESVAGAKGLMQVIPRYHVDKFRQFGGEEYAVFDPQTNILVGTRILKDYLAQSGSLGGALQLYVGNTSTEQDPYIAKVMSERELLQQVLRKPGSRTAAQPPLAGERFAAVSFSN